MTFNPKPFGKRARDCGISPVIWLIVLCIAQPVGAQQAGVANIEPGPTASHVKSGPVIITLLDQAMVKQEKVYLADVADLTGQKAALLGQLQVGQFKKNQQQITITLQWISQQLADQSLARTALTLRGHGRCTVTRQREVASLPEAILAKQSPLIANSQNAVDVGTALTLEDRLIDALEQYAAGTPGELVIQLSDRDRKLLAVAAEQGQYRFEPTQGNQIWGRLTVNIYQYQADKQVKTMTVRVRVQRRMLAAVALVPIGPGQMLTRQNITVQEVLIDRDRGLVVNSLKVALGKQVRKRLVAGQVLLAHEIKKPLLVRRGEIISVRYVGGGLVIITAGRAMEDGVMGDVIQVRNTRPRTIEAGRSARQSGDVYDAQVSGNRQVSVNFLAQPPTQSTPGSPGSQRSASPARLVVPQAVMKG